MLNYQELKGRNILGVLRGLLRDGTLALRGSDNKLVANLSIEWNTPWVYHKGDFRHNCFLWKQVTFHEIVEKHLPREKWFAPLGCQECFKVVVRPQTLEQLFALEQLQKRLDRPSKCGIEMRPSVFGNYGGYFYNRGVNEGLECWRLVKAAVAEDPLLGPTIPVILKRGCTEIEHGVGPSDKWGITPEQVELEQRLHELFVNDIPAIQQRDHFKQDVRQRWIEFAYDRGDVTAAKFNEGKPLYPDYVTYQHMAEEGGSDAAEA